MKTAIQSQTRTKFCQSSRRVHPLLLAILGGLLVASSIYSLWLGRDTSGVAEPAVPPETIPEVHDYSADIELYNAEVADILRRHLQRLEEMETEFRTEIGKQGPERFREVRNAIPGIQNSVSGLKMAAAIVKDAAMDKVRGGNRLGERFVTLLEKPFILPCARAGESLLADLDGFSMRLDAESRAFRDEIGSLHQSLPDPVRAEFPETALLNGLNQVYGSFDKVAIKGAFVGVETLGELICIRGTIAALERLVLRLGAGAIGKATTSVVAPMADGPLPVGDLIAVGCAVWTAWDIRALSKVLPQEFGKSLAATIDQTENETVARVRAVAGETYVAHAAMAKAWAESAHMEIPDGIS